MLKDKFVEVVISSSNFNKYIDKYGPFKKGDRIKIDINDLSKNSVVKIVAVCDICGKEAIVKYQNYNIQVNKGGYYCCKICSVIKQKETMNKNNTKYYLCCSEFKDKMTSLYGVDNPSKIDKIRKIRSTRLSDKKYQLKLLNGIINKYNIDNVSKLELIKEKKKQTCLKNYGVENPIQFYDIFLKSQKNGKNIKLHEETNLFYRGSYEKHFLDYCFKNGIKVEKGVIIKINNNNKNKYYYSDFFIRNKNLVVEIKSSYYYNKYLELNELKKEYTLKNGYDYIIIIDKNYDEFNKLIK